MRLPVDERELLAGLPEGLRRILRGEVRSDVHDRLFPPGSSDPDVERDYRSLVGQDLVDGRLTAVDAFAESLEGGRVRRRMWVVDLDDEQAHAWLSVTNDLRLVLAPLAGVMSEEAWSAGPDQASGESVLLYHLSWLQEELLAALMATLPPGEPDDPSDDPPPDDPPPDTPPPDTPPWDIMPGG